jgi:hypothetical protein
MLELDGSGGAVVQDKLKSVIALPFVIRFTAELVTKHDEVIGDCGCDFFERPIHELAVGRR